jgi:Glycosyl transferase family 2
MGLSSGDVIGVTMVRDEIDIIASTLHHIAGEVDHIVVADNGSTDGTRDILSDLANDLPLTIIDDPDPAYYQSRKMTNLGNMAHEQGARWIIPFDADELWLSDGRVGTDLMSLDESIRVHDVALYNHFPSSIDPAGTNPFITIRWRQRKPATLPKIAVRWTPGTVIHQGNHGVTLPGPRDPGCRRSGLLTIRHFPYRSAEQFVRKAINGAAAYAATDLPIELGAHWRQYGEVHRLHGPDAVAGIFRQHFWYLSPLDGGLVEDPAPYRRWDLYT